MSLGISYQISAVDKISKVADKISSKVDKMDNKIEKVGRTSEKVNRKMKRSFKGMGRSASRLGGKLKALAGLAVGAFALKNVFRKGMEFEDSMAGVAAITNASAKNLKIFENESKRMAVTFGVSASSIANSFLDIGSAKSELLDQPMQLSKIVEQTVLLAKAGDVDMSIATNAMTKSLNIFKQGAGEAKRFSDVMIAGTVVGAAKLDEFAMSILNTGGSAARAGLDIETTTALLQLLSKGGEVSSRAGTALDAFFRKMEEDKFKDVDISSGEKILDLMEKLSKMDEKGSLNLNTLFGAEATRAVGIMLSQREFFGGFLKDVRNSGGSTQIAADIRMSTTSEKLARSRARMDNAMLGLFVKLEPLLTSMVEKFIKWVDSLTSDDIQKFGKIIDNIVQGALKIGKFFGGSVTATGTIGTMGGEGVAAIASGDFSQFSDESKVGAMGVVSGMGLSPLFGFLSAMTSDDSKTKLEITMKGNTENIASVKQTTEKLNSGNSKRKSRVKSNMGQ